MFNKQIVLILTVALIVGAAGIVMAAPGTNGMPCFDPAVRQQMMDSHVQSGYVTQEQADLMNKQMDQMMTNGQSNSTMNGGPMNPMMPAGPRGNTPATGK